MLILTVWLSFGIPAIFVMLQSDWLRGWPISHSQICIQFRNRPPTKKGAKMFSTIIFFRILYRFCITNEYKIHMSKLRIAEKPEGNFNEISVNIANVIFVFLIQQ